VQRPSRGRVEDQEPGRRLTVVHDGRSGGPPEEDGRSVAALIDRHETDAVAARRSVTSNVGGMLAGIGASAAAGAGIGAVVGSFIPVPGVGTAVGVVGGVVVGTVVGAFTSGAIDSLFDNGMDDLGDVGDALASGWQEVQDLGSTIGDAGSAVGGAVGDFASDTWNSIFG
jgi:hypothetical protein